MRPVARLELDRAGETTIARLEGEIDLSNCEALRDRIAHSVPNEALALVIDLTDVRYLDSSGVWLLFELARRLELRQQRLAIAVPRESPVREIILLSGGDERLELHETVGEALARVRAQAKLPEA